MTTAGRRDFVWREFDARYLLPENWQQRIIEFANASSTDRTIVAASVTSREVHREVRIPVQTTGGRKIRRGLPWLYSLYQEGFRDLAQQTTSEQVSTAKDDRYAINLNVQRGNQMRYECHVDSNPVEGLLYVTDHPKGSGGELVVSNRFDALGPEQVETDCIRIYPRAGSLIFFDARLHPHYVAPLMAHDAVRVVVAMNYYTPSSTEEMRPKDLNRHLFGED